MFAVRGQRSPRRGELLAGQVLLLSGTETTGRPEIDEHLKVCAKVCAQRPASTRSQRLCRTSPPA